MCVCACVCVYVYIYRHSTSESSGWVPKVVSESKLSLLTLLGCPWWGEGESHKPVLGTAHYLMLGEGIWEGHIFTRNSNGKFLCETKETGVQMLFTHILLLKDI